jgi:hypothetical protein
MHVKIDQAGRDDFSGAVDLFDRGLRIADCGLIGNPAVDD